MKQLIYYIMWKLWIVINSIKSQIKSEIRDQEAWLNASSLFCLVWVENTCENSLRRYRSNLFTCLVMKRKINSSLITYCSRWSFLVWTLPLNSVQTFIENVTRTRKAFFKNVAYAMSLRKACLGDDHFHQSKLWQVYTYSVHVKLSLKSRNA